MFTAPTYADKLSGDGHRIAIHADGGFSLIDSSGDRIVVDRKAPMRLGPWGEGLVPSTTGLHTIVWPEHILQLAARFDMRVQDEAGNIYRITREP